MKKLLAFGVASVMALSLAACGGASSTAASSEAADTASSEAATTEATGKKWTIATDTVFKPFEYTDASGNFVGIDVDILAAIAEDQGFEYELKSLGWDASIAACQAGQADGMIAGASIKQDRIDSGANDTGYPENAVLWQNNAQVQVQGNCLCLIALPDGYTIAWSGSSYQEKLVSSGGSLVFVLALVMVFLILAAQYESWSLPLTVLTAVPFGVLGAITAIWLRGISNDVYFQVALVTLIGLSAKNAILIVEFAVEQYRNEGKDAVHAAEEAARLRFRPIVMTSLAFILGCVPLAVSTGAGAASRHAIGTSVIGGMLVATLVAPLFVPFFFRWIMRASEKLMGTGKKEE